MEYQKNVNPPNADSAAIQIILLNRYFRDHFPNRYNMVTYMHGGEVIMETQKGIYKLYKDTEWIISKIQQSRFYHPHWGQGKVILSCLDWEHLLKQFQAYLAIVPEENIYVSRPS